MQTAPKTSRIKFAVRLLAVILCLAIGLSGVVIPARGSADPVHDQFIIIASTLAGLGIDSNIGNVTMFNWTSFPDLYFEKRTIVTDSTTAIGKIIFTSAVDFSSLETQTFLTNLGTKMQMSDGQIAFDASTSAEFAAHGATLVMYGIPPGRSIADLTVSADDGTIIPTASVVSGFTQNPSKGDVSFNAAHFTKFEINTTSTTFQIYLPLVIR
jgi:hypothetical protein